MKQAHSSNNQFDKPAPSQARSCKSTPFGALLLVLASPTLALAQELPVMDVPNDPMSMDGAGASPVTGARTIPYFTYTTTDPSNGKT